jgi:hypothetical protein
VVAWHALHHSLPTRSASIQASHCQMKACFVGEDEATAIQRRNLFAKSGTVGFDPLGSREAFFYAAALTFVAPDKESKHAPALWHACSSKLLIQRAWHLAVTRLARAVTGAVCLRGLLGSRHHAASERGSHQHDRVSTFWRRYNDQPQKYGQSRRVCLHHFHKQVQVSLVSQLNTPS